MFVQDGFLYLTVTRHKLTVQCSKGHKYRDYKYHMTVHILSPPVSENVVMRALRALRLGRCDTTKHLESTGTTDAPAEAPLTAVKAKFGLGRNTNCINPNFFYIL